MTLLPGKVEEKLKRKDKLMNPQMPPETQHEQKSNALKAFAARSPFFFALVFFVVSFCLSLVGPPASLWGVVQSLFAIGVLAWLGWLRLAGFNGPSQWRSLHLFWLPGLLALFYLFPFLLTMQGSGAVVLVLLLAFVLLIGVLEELLFLG